MQLAEWFSGCSIAPGEDDIFDKVVRKVVSAGESRHVRFVQWDSADNLREKLVAVLVEELKLSSPDDIPGFDASLGGIAGDNMRFFNVGAANCAEKWQILSPVRKNETIDPWYFSDSLSEIATL